MVRQVSVRFNLSSNYGYVLNGVTCSTQFKKYLKLIHVEECE